MSLTLDFEKENVHALSIEQLKDSVQEDMIGRLPLHGITHIDMFERVNDLLSQTGLDYGLAPIFAANNKSKNFPGVTIVKALEEAHGINSIKTMILRRLLGRFVIKSNQTDEELYAVAIGFHQDGIQVAFGPHVKICKNLSILGSDRIISTYGPDKVSVDKMFDVLRGKMAELPSMQEQDFTLMNKMRNVLIPQEDVKQIIGEMTLKRVYADTGKVNRNAEVILNQGQISKFSEIYVDKVKPYDNDGNSKTVTLYELYNMGTGLLKPETSDLPTIINQNWALGKYLINYYKSMLN